MFNEKATTEIPLPLYQVLEEEYTRLHGPLPDSYPKSASDKDRLSKIYKLIHGLPQKRAALCLSGGGIRSATFALGVLQGLAAQGLLDKFDYLSTVSGGGYIGSWLTAWIHRHPKGAQGVITELRSAPKSKLDPEPEPIQHLRAYSNYITPRLGLLSADTWTVVGTYLRNLLLNWLVLIPLLVAVLAIPRLSVAVVRSNPDDWFKLGTLAIGLFLGVVAIAYISMNLPSVGDSRKDQGGFLLLCLLPLVGSAITLTSYWAWYRNPEGTPYDWLTFVLFGALLHSVGWLWCAVHVYRSKGFRKLLVIFGTVAIVGAAGGLLVWWVSTSTQIQIFLYPKQFAEYYACFAAPVLLALFLLAMTLFIGIASRWTDDEDREWWARSGAWALIVIVVWSTISSLVIFGPAVLSKIPKTVTSLGGVSGLITILLGRSAKTPANPNQKEKAGWQKVALTLAAPLFAAFLVVILSLGTSDLIEWLRTSGLIEWLRTSRLIKWIPAGISLDVKLVGVLLIAMLVIGFGMALAINVNKFSLHAMYRNRLVRAYLGASRETRDPNPFTEFDPDDNVGMHELRPELLHLGSFKDLAGLAVKLRDGKDSVSQYLQGQFTPHTRQLLAQYDDSSLPSEMLRKALIDELNQLLQADSLHVKPCFEQLLNLTEEIRGLVKQNPQGDSLILLNRLLLEQAYTHQIENFRSHKPLHVVNITLNLVKGENLAWQQRKAGSFTVTPLHSGSCRLGYRRSKDYGQTKEGEGISLGTAVTISGAAASPNMGYYSSPAITFLMTLFNARLGWWLGNPGVDGNKTFQRSYPKFAVGPMVAEAFGLTDDKKRYVYLSDGGHFENLGLYEMVLRRCHLIVVSDAGCDPGCEFEDLGNAIRKIRIDLGVPIEIQIPIYSRSRQSKKPGKYCAIGTIRYSCVDDGPGTDGVLIYLKPAFYGNEPADIFNYAQANETFPHETTVDQWFSEPQFESYRMLGFYIINNVICGENWKGTGLDDFKSQAHKYLGQTDFCL